MSIPIVLAESSPGLAEGIRGFFVEGGIPMYLLAVTSVAGGAAILFKFLSLTRERVIPDELANKIERVDEVVANGEEEGVLSQFNEGRSALARLCAVAVKRAGRPLSEIAEAVQSSARQEIVRMQAGMTVIDIVITVAPLLGLLGTASGLKEIFGGLQGDSDWVKIGFGIGRALQTTIVGLAIAVPAIIAQGYFQRRIDTFASRLEVLLTKLAQACEKARPAEEPPARS